MTEAPHLRYGLCILQFEHGHLTAVVQEEERMAAMQRTPRDILLDIDADYRRLFEEHEHYEEELQKILKSPYLSSEDLLEEIKLKKMKLHCKDEMERIALRIQRARAAHS